MSHMISHTQPEKHPAYGVRQKTPRPVRSEHPDRPKPQQVTAIWLWEKTPVGYRVKYRKKATVGWLASSPQHKQLSLSKKLRNRMLEIFNLIAWGSQKGAHHPQTSSWNGRLGCCLQTNCMPCLVGAGRYDFRGVHPRERKSF